MLTGRRVAGSLLLPVMVVVVVVVVFVSMVLVSVVVVVVVSDRKSFVKAAGGKSFRS